MKVWYFVDDTKPGETRVHARATQKEIKGVIQAAGYMQGWKRHAKSKEFPATAEGILKAVEFGTLLKVEFKRRML